MKLNILRKSSSLPTFNLLTFFFLYIAQTVPSTFFSTSIQVIMRQANYSLSAIALLQIIKIPWILKFTWSPIVDRNCNSINSYKKCIFLSEIVYAILILIVGFLNLSKDFYWILALVFLSLAASATQDIATDALSVRAFKKKDKSMINSMQSMGSFGGALLGGGILLMILHKFGWHYVIPCLSVFVLIALIPLLLNKNLHLHVDEKRRRARFTDFIWFFTQKGIGKQVGFLILYYASIIGILSILRPYLVDYGYSMKDIGMMSGILGTSCAFIASFFGGIIVRRIGLHLSRLIFAGFILITTIYFLLLSWIEPNIFILCGGIILVWCSYGMATIVVYTSAMNCVRPGCEGTDFTIQTVITHLSGLVIALFSGKVADTFGYHGLFGMETIIALISLIYVWKIIKK